MLLIDQAQEKLWSCCCFTVRKTEAQNRKGSYVPDGVAQWLSINPCTKRSPVQFPVRARGQVVGPIPFGGHVGGGQSMFSLSLPLSLPLSLKPIKKRKGATGQLFDPDLDPLFASLNQGQAGGCMEGRGRQAHGVD
uniref:Uncharacterized protein n=1 Tax=Molossus molossus TaxID=27622 RepID=A0A7J8EE16_MOLMO|nr:hypothetical protein HJG59_008822 [Molossus molossus]